MPCKLTLWPGKPGRENAMNGFRKVSDKYYTYHLSDGFTECNGEPVFTDNAHGLDLFLAYIWDKQTEGFLWRVTEAITGHKIGPASEDKDFVLRSVEKMLGDPSQGFQEHINRAVERCGVSPRYERVQ